MRKQEVRKVKDLSEPLRFNSLLGYITTLSVFRWYSVDKRLINELRRIWKEIAMA
jgi:hypothetical protein